jgi:hypothetical protein
MNPDAHRGQDDISDMQPRQLRYAKTGAHGEVQHGTVANSFTLRRVGRIQQGLHLRLLEIGDQTGVGLLVRNCQDPTNLFQGGGLAILKKVKNERIAARRMLRVEDALRRPSSRCSRNDAIRDASMCSTVNADGESFSRFAANSNSR